MPGDFSQEAYEQLRAAYAKETNTQLDAEIEGVKVGGQEMTLETLPVDSPWKSKIENWEYPTGRSQYLDGKQDPAEILAIMRGAAQEQDDAEKLEEAKELVAEAEADEAKEEAEAEKPVAETEELNDEDLGEMSDEEFEKFVDDILDGVGDDEELEDGEEEDEEETEEPVAEVEAEAEVEETKEEAEEETEEDEEYDPQAVADEISRLKDELENMRFVPTEEPKADDESD